jgi:hypothetical protein
MALAEIVNKHKRLLDCGLYPLPLIIGSRLVAFESLSNDHLTILLRQLKKENLMMYSFAQRLVALAQQRKLIWDM